jgi:IS5 family transposase
VARADAHVGHLQSLTGPEEVRAERQAVAGPSLTVTFADGRLARLNLTDYRSRVWAQVLQNLYHSGQPAYVEIDPDSRLITQLLQPLRFTVGDISKVDGGLQVDLNVSQGRHYLRRSNPDFETLRVALENARKRGTPLLVTETLNEHEIIHVQPAVQPARRRR